MCISRLWATLELRVISSSSSSSSNFLIYEIGAAEEAAEAIFGRYLVAQWRQLLAAAVTFRAEQWVQILAIKRSFRRWIIISCADTRIITWPSSPFRRQLCGINFQLGSYEQGTAKQRHAYCGGRVFYDTAIPGDILIGGSPVGGSSTNNYVNTRVLSQCLLLPAHSIRNENESTRISARVLFWYAMVAWDGTMQWPCGWNKFPVAI